MLHITGGTQNDSLSSEDLKNGLYKALDKLGDRNKVLVVPPDQTRIHSRAGDLTRFAWKYYGEKLSDILPALGTHTPMTDYQLSDMFGKIPLNLFREHDWRNDVVTLGKVPGSIISEVSEGRLNFDWEAQVNRLLVEGGHDLILSIGQVVPHEVIGMANYNKNIFVGTGGTEGINKSHYLGAVYGMERIMGRADNPVRSVLNYASGHFSSNLPPIIYVLTVIGRDESGRLVPRGLFIGDDQECFYKAADLSLKVNFEMLEKPLDKVVVYLDPSEYKSTWLGNKAIYRTRMALANGGDLLILAPGVKEFGEDAEIDKLIRKYGYRGTETTIHAVEENADLSNNLAAAAHLIHGSSDGRFNIIYSPGKLSKMEIEGVGFQYADFNEMINKYNPSDLLEGYNALPDGQKIFYISNPALGLWTTKSKFT
ncbi:MAG: lactate racemase domain-containing protein [Bacteroidota bacterium]|nr:lactate racemase domain-containing protein [Bacteroidota bacterium]